MRKYPDSFPWNKKDFFKSGQVIPYGEKIRMGPWEIGVDITLGKTMKMKPVFNSWEEFMSGNIEYCINVPQEEGEDPIPLEIVQNFTKPSRPQSWKKKDLKIQSNLPLVGHSSDVLAKWDENTPTVVANVSMKLTRSSFRERDR